MRNTVSQRHVFLSRSLFAAILTSLVSIAGAQTIQFREDFDDTNFAARGWYDLTGGTIDTSVYSPSGGSSSLKISWTQGSTAPGTPRRHSFTASDTVYVSCWMKFGTSSATWRGSGVSYHPHLLQLLTNADDDWAGPAWTHLSMRIETTLFTPRAEFQDGQRINTGQLGVSLLGTATSHAIAGGNGNQTPTSTYWFDGTDYWNNSDFDAAAPAFVNNTWHHVEFYVAMNSILGGIPQADGVIKYWVDGRLVIDKTNVYLRTAQYATQKFDKLLLVPYIGVGSPIAQDMWIDNLVVADKPIAPPGGLSAPTNLRVIQ
jgi:hypothetical protein